MKEFNYVRRKLAQKYNEIKMQTPILLEILDILKNFKISKERQDLFMRGDAGTRFEYLLFEEVIERIFISEIETLLSFDENELSLEEHS